MTALELLSIVFGLVSGYWIISLLTGGKVPTRRHNRPRHERGNEEAKEHSVPPPASSPDESTAWHTVLNVSCTASVDEIKLAYQRAIRQYHPDKVETLGEEVKALCAQKSVLINFAYSEALRAKGISS